MCNFKAMPLYACAVRNIGIWPFPSLILMLAVDEKLIINRMLALLLSGEFRMVPIFVFFFLVYTLPLYEHFLLYGFMKLKVELWIICEIRLFSCHLLSPFRLLPHAHLTAQASFYKQFRRSQ